MTDTLQDSMLRAALLIAINEYRATGNVKHSIDTAIKEYKGTTENE